MFFKSFKNCLVRSKIPSGITFNEAVVLGRRYSGTEAVEAGIAQKVTPSLDTLLAEAKKVASDLAAKEIDRENLQNMKRGMYSWIIRAREEMIGKEDAIGDLASKL